MPVDSTALFRCLMLQVQFLRSKENWNYCENVQSTRVHHMNTGYYSIMSVILAIIHIHYSWHIRGIYSSAQAIYINHLRFFLNSYGAYKRLNTQHRENDQGHIQQRYKKSIWRYPLNVRKIVGWPQGICWVMAPINSGQRPVRGEKSHEDFSRRGKRKCGHASVLSTQK